MKLPHKWLQDKWLQARVYGFAFQRQHAENAFVDAAQRFMADEPFQRLDAQGELAAC